MSNAEARRRRHAAIRAEITDEEDAAGSAEVAEHAAASDESGDLPPHSTRGTNKPG